MSSGLGVSKTRLSALDVFEVAAETAALNVVLCHGYGANGADLVPLSGETPCRRAYRWLFPEAPGVTPYGGRAWFPIDEEKLMEAQRTGVARDFGGEDPPGLEASGKAVAAMLDAAGLDPSRTVLGGFSQGSMVALETATALRTPPAGLILLSGNLIAAARWGSRLPKLRGVPFFQSHGRHDPILGFGGAQALETLLRDAGLKGNFLAFDGEHSIPGEVVEGLAVFLDGL